MGQGSESQESMTLQEGGGGQKRCMHLAFTQRRYFKRKKKLHFPKGCHNISYNSKYLEIIQIASNVE